MRLSTGSVHPRLPGSVKWRSAVAQELKRISFCTHLLMPARLPVLEADRSSGNAYARTGTLSSSNSALINWSNPVKISDDKSNSSTYPSVATDGTFAFATWTSYSFDITGVIYDSVARLP
jgi:hypothetical protein